MWNFLFAYGSGSLFRMFRLILLWATFVVGGVTKRQRMLVESDSVNVILFLTKEQLEFVF